MIPLGLRMNRVAMDLRVPVTRIADILNEKRAITAATALRFAHYFASIWKTPNVAANICPGTRPRSVRHAGHDP
jgi:plasmid maintenance system antidote protein VapI